MPSRGRKFIDEFLLPSLNKKIFGSRLMWLDVQNKVFQIQWNHKGASDWTIMDAAVFSAWDIKRGHYKPDDKEYYTKSKQRFRASLYKFIKQKNITELCSESKYTKIYCVGDGKNISEAFITSSKNEKENITSFQKVKQNPEDLVIDFSSIWNSNLLTEPHESCYDTHNLLEIKGEYFSEEEQVVTDCTEESIHKPLHYENLQISAAAANFTADNEQNLQEIETSITLQESDVNSLYVELYLAPKTRIFENDNSLKKLKTIENDNFHDYLNTVTDTTNQMDYPHYEFHDEDSSFDLPLPCI